MRLNFSPNPKWPMAFLLRTIVLSIFIFYQFHYLVAQSMVRTGKVRELNSKRKPIEGVFIKFSGAVPTRTGTYGDFQLIFKGQKAGDLTWLLEAIKPGFELVNARKFEDCYLSDDGKFSPDIIMAPKGVVNQLKKEYYSISDSTLIARYESEKNLLRRKLKRSEVSREEYEIEKEILLSELETHKKELDQLSDKYARINLDDIDSVDRSSLELFLAGLVEEAITCLEEANLEKITKDITEEKGRIETLESEIIQRNIILENRKRRHIERLCRLNEWYSLQFSTKKIEKTYEEILILDPLNINILYQAGKFYLNQQRYVKSEEAFTKVIKNCNNDNWRYSLSYRFLIKIALELGEIGMAIQYIENFRFYSNERVTKKPSVWQARFNVALTDELLGNIYNETGNIDSALHCYTRHKELMFKLSQDFPNNIQIKNSVGISFEKLGELYYSMGDLEKALNLFTRYQKITEEIFKLDQTAGQSGYYQNVYSVSFEKIGDVLMASGELETALRNYEIELEYARNLHSTFPENSYFKSGLGIVYGKLGQVYNHMGENHKTKIFIQNYSRIFKELYLTHPKNVDYCLGYAITLFDLGVMIDSIGDLTHLLHSAKLLEGLASIPGQKVDPVYWLASCYREMGVVYFRSGDMLTAMRYSERSLFHSHYLMERSPRIVEFKRERCRSILLKAKIQYATGNKEESISGITEVIKTLTSLDSELDPDIYTKDVLVEALMMKADLSRESKIRTKKIERFQILIAHLNYLIESAPHNKKWSDLLNKINTAMDN